MRSLAKALGTVKDHRQRQGLRHKLQAILLFMCAADVRQAVRRHHALQQIAWRFDDTAANSPPTVALKGWRLKVGGQRREYFAGVQDVQRVKSLLDALLESD